MQLSPSLFFAVSLLLFFITEIACKQQFITNMCLGEFPGVMLNRPGSFSCIYVSTTLGKICMNCGKTFLLIISKTKRIIDFTCKQRQSGPFRVFRIGGIILDIYWLNRINIILWSAVISNLSKSTHVIYSFLFLKQPKVCAVFA